MFWQLEDLIPFGNNLLFRYLAGWLMPPKVSLLRLTQGNTVNRLHHCQHLTQVEARGCQRLPEAARGCQMTDILM